MQLDFTHWQIKKDSQDIVWLAIDCQNETTNTLSEAVILELGQALESLHKTLPAGLVIYSAKKTGFIAGADIREFDHYTQSSEIEAKIHQVHAVFESLEKLPCPTVAAVSGFCLGGGLELALCCDYLIAQDLPSTRVGLPEVKLGIYPGFGGSVRLPHKIGGLQAIPLMLTGKLLRPRPAKALGIVDQVIGFHDSLHWHARKAILQKRRSKGAGLFAKLSNTLPMRIVLAKVMINKTKAKANPDHYPSPYRLIDNWKQYFGNRKLALTKEAQGVAELVLSDTSINLRRVFRLMEQLKAQGKQSPVEIKRVHVVGAGVMGGDIAAWCALQGMQVTLQDRQLDLIEPALKRAKKLFKKRLRKKPLIGAAIARLIADVEGKGAERADLVIEAIFEDVDAKQSLFKSLESRLKPEAILATNTSALSIEELATCLADDTRLIGLHFFNPVAQMPLVEVVVGESSSDLSVDIGSAFCSQINRFPLPVKSSPGFLVNRVLLPYMIEAMVCHNEGYQKQDLDRAAELFGMPMGPVELADIVGLDVCQKVATTLMTKDISNETDLLEGLITDGHMGKKTGKGFYTWIKGKAKKPESTLSSAELEALGERILKPFLDECVACDAEKIVEDADLLDAGIIFGTGFAPFRGGPMHYLGKSL